MTRVPSGSAGIASSGGAFHAAITPPGVGDSGVFGRLGGYSSTFGGGYIASLDVYVDLSDPTVPANTYGWDLSVASSNQAGSHLRDFVFHTASNPLGQVLVGASNNSNFTRRNDLGSISHYTITTSGWYRFEYVFRDNGSGALAVDLNLRRRSDNALLWSDTKSDPGDLISTIVGGNRYMWFTFLETPYLAVDNANVRSLARVVDSFGVGGWRSGDTRTAAGVNLKGATLSHPYVVGATAAHDILIAKQINFMGEGQVVPSLTTGVPGPAPAGSLGGRGYVRLDGTNANTGKSDFTTYNPAGFGLSNDIFAPGFEASYRYYTESLSTSRTPGFSFYGYNPTTNQYFSLTYVQPTYTPNSWNTASMNDTSTGWAVRVNFTSVLGGAIKSIADWKLEPAAAAIFGPTAFVYEHGFNLGSFQRECAVYLDWMQMSTLYGGDTVDFQAMAPMQAALPVDLNGVYSAPGATTTSNAVASASTSNSVSQVEEQAAGVSAQENTFTPFSDVDKKPAQLSVNMAGKSYSVDLDVMDASLWTAGREYFQVGLGQGVGYANGTAESFVAIRKSGSSFEIFHATDRGAAVPVSYVSAADNTRFRVQVSIDALSTTAKLTITPLNGTGAGLAVDGGTYALDIVNDNVSSTSFFAGFSSSTATPNSARMAVSNFRTNASTNSQFVFSNDPYNKSNENAYYALGQANLNTPVGGFQSFMAIIGSLVAQPSTYTLAPYSQHPVTATPWPDAYGFIPNNGTLSQSNEVLGNLLFSGANGAKGSLSINATGGAFSLDTQFNDGDGNAVAATRQGSNVALFDDNAPSIGAVSATQAGNPGCPSPVVSGLLDIKFNASDAFTGLAQQPWIKLDFAPLGAGPEDVNLTTVSYTANQFGSTYVVPNTAPNGTGAILVTAIDRAGNSVTSTTTMNVNTATLTVNLQLQGVSVASLTRGVEITLGGNPASGSNPAIVLNRDVTFLAGSATVVFNALDGIPNTSGVLNYAVGAKDTLHTLRSTVAAPGVGNQYVANVNGLKALRGGNLNNDNKIDIGDYVVYATRYGIAVNPNTPFATLYGPHAASLRHADIDGSGNVDGVEFSYISAAFGTQFDDAAPGTYGRDDRTIRTKITVADAIREAGKDAAKLDLDGDGVITLAEIQRYLSGRRR